MFAANMKMKGTKEQKSAKVDDILQTLQLVKCQNTYVGGALIKGISGGERKRTCIALELFSNPSLLILDEPTSGLDSFTAYILIDLLRGLANEGRTIIFTIHQPSSEIFGLFDRLMLLKNGSIIYQGDSQGILPYMDQLSL